MELFDTILARRKASYRRGPPRYNTRPSAIEFNATVNRLPNEIWILICERADFASSKQLRLVNKTLCQLAAKKVFSEVYITALPDSFAKLQAISHHPFLSTLVESAVYLMDRLDSHVAQAKNWKGLAAHVSTYELSEDTKAKSERLRYLYNQQQVLVKDGAEVAILKECVSRLPNLQDVEIAAASTLAARFEDGDGPQPIVGPLFWETLLDTERLFTSGIYERKFSRPLVAWIKALHHNRMSLRNLEIDDIPFGFWEYTNHPPLFPQIKPCIEVVFANMKYLKMMCWMGSMGRASWGRAAPISHFIGFLAAAPQLESLQIWVRPINEAGEEYFEDEEPDFTDVFFKLTLSKLAHLRLDGFKTDRDAFIGFVERHSGCLRHLTLQFMELTEPTSASSSLQGQTDSKVKPGASWEFAIKYLAPIMDLHCAQLAGLDDTELQRQSGAPISLWYTLEKEQHRLRQKWCDEVSEWFACGGEFLPFPVYGQEWVVKCPCCNMIISRDGVACSEDGDEEGTNVEYSDDDEWDSLEEGEDDDEDEAEADEGSDDVEGGEEESGSLLLGWDKGQVDGADDGAGEIEV